MYAWGRNYIKWLEVMFRTLQYKGQIFSTSGETSVDKMATQVKIVKL